MRKGVEWIDRRYYPRFSGNWDDQLFRACILEVINPGSVVLDLGAGAGIVKQMNFRGLAGKVCGIDLDPRVTTNPYLDEGRVAAGESIPYSDATFDVVFSDNVLEHLAEPTRVFAEVGRVLKPGGQFLLKTPNRFHYVPLIASVTPHWFHRAFNRLRGRAAADTFPTLYRANTPRAVARIALQTGLRVNWVKLHEGRPEYLRFHVLPYIAGLVYERLVNRLPFLAAFRVLMIASLSRPESGS